MTASRLHVMHLVFSLHTGGLENGVVNLCNRLDPEKFAPSIMVFQAGGELEVRVSTDRVALFHVPRHWNNDPTLPFRLGLHIWRRGVDILHTHSWGTLVEGVLAAKMARVPVLIHGEHGVIQGRPHNIHLQRMLWPRCDVVTAVSAPLADRLTQAVGFPRDRIRVIENGVDTDRFCPQRDQKSRLRSKFAFAKDGCVIGCAARLVPVKNHVGMLYALANLKAKGVLATLALAGDGPMRDDLQRVAHELEIADQVRFLGNVARIEEFLNAVDLFLLNSESEGMSNTILEAMACGLPVVATDVGANSNLVVDRQTGFLVPANDVERLADALAMLAKDDAKQRIMGDAGRNRIEQHFSMERMVQRYSALYEKFRPGSRVLRRRFTETRTPCDPREIKQSGGLGVTRILAQSPKHS